MPPLHPECKPIFDEIQALEQQKDALQADLLIAPPNQKASIVAQIKKLNTAISAKQKLLDLCMGRHPLPTPVSSRLTGTATIWLSPQGAGGVASSIQIEMIFYGYDYKGVNLKPFNIIFSKAYTFSNGIFNYSADVTLSGKEDGDGQHDINSHHISIPVTITYTLSSLSGYFGFLYGTPKPSALTLFAPGLTTQSVPSNLSITGSTTGSPWRTSPGPDLGKITLVGSCVANGGYIDKKIFDIKIEGVMLPIPRL